MNKGLGHWLLLDLWLTHCRRWNSSVSIKIQRSRGIHLVFPLLNKKVGQELNKLTHVLELTQHINVDTLVEENLLDIANDIADHALVNVLLKTKAVIENPEKNLQSHNRLSKKSSSKIPQINEQM
jgi:hypothetical protein